MRLMPVARAHARWLPLWHRSVTPRRYVLACPAVRGPACVCPVDSKSIGRGLLCFGTWVAVSLQVKRPACCEASSTGDGSVQVQEATTKAEDSLWHEATATAWIPHRATDAFAVVADVASWAEFMPFCQCSRLLRDIGSGRRQYEVNFGLALGPVFVGDRVVYEISSPAPGQLSLRSTNNQELHYAESIEYMVSVHDETSSMGAAGAKVSVHLRFHARRLLYLRVWQGVEERMVEALAACLRERLLDASAVVQSPVHGF
eukprot:gnl/TRDRNA2_/TRDRNA2_69431_c0_seq1.p1 gnl/TRDRNA2_/TRDRNA2_69431_c0~~gnl/TRDRNA2_/TRDRNA2_69431_c0_seq1.p1  ORF type:complete len:267 (+),score=20.59 gnl/TRDRNA2_/TRDRNA2_69431_c0_seq1:27-803(+)